MPLASALTWLLHSTMCHDESKRIFFCPFGFVCYISKKAYPSGSPDWKENCCESASQSSPLYLVFVYIPTARDPRGEVTCLRFLFPISAVISQSHIAIGYNCKDERPRDCLGAQLYPLFCFSTRPKIFPTWLIAYMTQHKTRVAAVIQMY